MISVEFSQKMIEAVLREWEAEHPGMNVDAMDSKEFAGRMMAKIMATAKVMGAEAEGHGTN